jgi:hypothetical protein
MKSKLSATMCSLALLGCMMGVAGSANAATISDTLTVQGTDSSGPFTLSGSLSEADEALGNNTITITLPPPVSFIANAVVLLTDSACSPNCVLTDLSDVIFSSSDGSQLIMRSGPPLAPTLIELLVAIAIAEQNGTIFVETGLPQDISQFFAPAGSGLSIEVTSAVPGPAALPLFATGLGAMGLLGWRRKRKAQAVPQRHN